MKAICERAIEAKIRTERELICKISPTRSTNNRSCWWWLWMKIKSVWRSAKISCSKQTASLLVKKFKTNKLCRRQALHRMSTNQSPQLYIIPTKPSNFKKKQTARCSITTQETISRHLVIKWIGKSIIRLLIGRSGHINLQIKSDYSKAILTMMCRSKWNSSSHRTLSARFKRH